MQRENTTRPNRPDLDRIDPEVVAYIEYLEAEIDRKKQPRREASRVEAEPEIEIPMPPGEPPTTMQVITITPSGIGKRTPRHLYSRQRRGGVGVFDLDTGEKESPSILTIADQGQSLVLFTNLARAYRLPVEGIPQTEVHARGQSIVSRLGLGSNEYIVAALPDAAVGAVILLGEHGGVRLLRHHVFGEYMKPGTVLFDVRTFGELTAACRTPGGGVDLFFATRKGKAIRFSEKLVPTQGGLGIRLEPGDKAAAVTAVYPDSQVFLLGADGKGTIRSMEGFSPNKSAGGSGKIAMNTDQLAAALSVDTNDDIFAISRLGKIIRFMAAEVPVKEGVVQGVNCMALRADEVVGVTTSGIKR